MLNAEGKSTTALHTRFDDKETDAMGLLQVGKFAARTMLSKRDVVGAIHQMSEQASTFNSLGILLDVWFAEAQNATKHEPHPNFYRLAVSCWIYDQICGVVGSYSSLLLKIRQELYSCLFSNFDPAVILNTAVDYSNLMPYFMEHTRVHSQLLNERKTREEQVVARASDMAAEP